MLLKAQGRCGKKTLKRQTPFQLTRGEGGDRSRRRGGLGWVGLYTLSGKTLPTPPLPRWPPARPCCAGDSSPRAPEAPGKREGVSSDATERVTRSWDRDSPLLPWASRRGGARSQRAGRGLPVSIAKQILTRPHTGKHPESGAHITWTRCARWCGFPAPHAVKAAHLGVHPPPAQLMRAPNPTATPHGSAMWCGFLSSVLCSGCHDPWGGRRGVCAG
jgi:hypothetical protein